MMQCQGPPDFNRPTGSEAPKATAIHFHLPKRRTSIRQPLRVLGHSRTPSPGQIEEREKVRIPRARYDAPPDRPVQVQHNFSISNSTSLDDVFADNSRAVVSGPMAATQFHNAAERLRLSTVSLATEKTGLDFDTAAMWIKATTQISPTTEKSQRPWSSRWIPSTPSKRPVTERDITSAQRLGNAEANSSEHGRNRDAPQTMVDTSPLSFRKNDMVSSAIGARREKAKNFSRPLQSKTLAQSRLLPNSANGPNQHGETTLVDNDMCKIKAAPVPKSGTSHPTAFVTPNTVENPTKPPRSATPEATSFETSRELRASFESAVTECLGDRRLTLKRWEVWLIRTVFALFVFGVNIAFGLAYLGSHKHPYLLATLVFMKSKDILSTLADILGAVCRYLSQLVWPPKRPTKKWILSLVCAYAETEEQIMKTVLSLVCGKLQPHQQAICIILDGKPRAVVDKLSTIKLTMRLPYTTWLGQAGELVIYAGNIKTTPVLLIEKVKNAGKKDSLVLGHDLFNYPREDMPKSTRLLRDEIWRFILPKIMEEAEFSSFDYIFCTDADSTIHENTLQKLADALCQETNAIAACGVLFAEFGPARTEYSPWHMFQQFQYTFGQYVRRQAESTWGRVTCLPGCITMIAIKPEIAPALTEYANPVMNRNIFRHQVQYLGTDRRLTWCITSQNKHVRTIFVPDALSETVVPNSLSHYLSQRRRWASNAYFNDFFYLLGPQQRLVTRVFAAIDIVRLTLVFYRVFNTAYFLHGLVTNFYVIKIIPTLIVTKTPATWYLLLTLCKQPLLRKRIHKVLLGMCINQFISPVLSVIVFVNVLVHMGSASWGKTGVSTQGNKERPVSVFAQESHPTDPWTPRRLAISVRTAIRAVTPKVRRTARNTTTPSTSCKFDPEFKQPVRYPKTPSALRAHTPDMNTQESRDPCAGVTSGVDTRDHGDNATDIATPTRRTRKNSSSTPGSMLRRFPRTMQRQRAVSKLTPLPETPSKSSQTRRAHDL